MQVVLVLDQREQFGRHVGGRVTNSRTESRDECVRQVRNLGINVEVCTQPTFPLSPAKINGGDPGPGLSSS